VAQDLIMDATGMEYDSFANGRPTEFLVWTGARDGFPHLSLAHHLPGWPRFLVPHGCLIPDHKHTAFARARKPQRTIVADSERQHVAEVR